jgi:hypothetical protein
MKIFEREKPQKKPRDLEIPSLSKEDDESKDELQGGMSAEDDT